MLRKSTSHFSFLRQAEFQVTAPDEGDSTPFFVTCSDRHGVVFTGCRNTLTVVKISDLEGLFDLAEEPQELPEAKTSHALPGGIIISGLFVSKSNDFLALSHATGVHVYCVGDLLSEVTLQPCLVTGIVLNLCIT